jgi:anti-sigma B factor antagonist
MPELSIQVDRVDGETSALRLVGFLDAHTFEQLDELVTDLFQQGVYRVVVDLSGLEYISSAGAGVFIGNLAAAQEMGGNIVLVNPTPNVREVFDLLGLSQIFTITGSREEALQALP